MKKMRIHTNLKAGAMFGLLKKTGAPIDYERMNQHHSKTHDRSFDVLLSGTGGKNNTGRYGTGNYNGADWDEWGAFFGALYDADPEARCGGTKENPIYACANDFHYKTGDRFHNIVKWSPSLSDYLPCYLPADTHKRHHWEFRSCWSDFVCTKCTATRPPNGSRRIYA